MNKIVHSIIVFIIFKIPWKKLLPIGAIITITFSLFQLKMLPYHLTTQNSSQPDTNHFDANLKSQITPMIRRNHSEAFKIGPVTTLLNTSSQLVQTVAVVPEKVKDTQRRSQMDIVRPNVSIIPSLPSPPSASERRKRYLVRLPSFC